MWKVGYTIMNKRFLQIAESLTPKLIKTDIKPIEANYGRPLSAGDSVTFDFGNHYVGYVKFKFEYVGSIPDAPAFIKLKFCETAHEINENTTDYNGWISKGWIQEEYVHLDVLPASLELKRRYAFRYVKIEVLAVSQKYRLCVVNASAQAVTSADKAVEIRGKNHKEKAIDKVSVRTLSECMQLEFEDGPKRDRRLWLGDLRLQALANYATFRQNDLVKRCLYLFAGTANEFGQVSACVFTKPSVAPDDTYMFDYSLLFIPTLLDYYRNSGDMETLEELFQTAWNQIEVSLSKFDENGLIVDSDVMGWCFLDWVLELNKQAGAQAVYIYCAKAMREICEILGKDTAFIEKEIEQKEVAAKNHLFDEELRLFVSGTEKQISYASNIWFVLAGVFDRKQNAAILNSLSSADAVKPVTPYMYHHYIQAQIDAGMRDEAYAVMMNYWGGMIEDGADTFYELFNPDNPNESPYGSRVVNSYCHAWSCTPSYFLRSYFC